jgi:hypothetical protein
VARIEGRFGFRQDNGKRPARHQSRELNASTRSSPPTIQVQGAGFKLPESLGLRPLDVGGLPMAATLESPGLMMIGSAKNGAGFGDIALHVAIG